MTKFTVKVAYNSEGERHEMTYTTDCQRDAQRFARYYRPKIGNGKILSVHIVTFTTIVAITDMQLF